MLTLYLQQTSGNKKAEEEAEQATQKQLDEIKQIGNKTGPKVGTHTASTIMSTDYVQVVDDLLKAVMTVNPVVPDRVEQPTV